MRPIRSRLMLILTALISGTTALIAGISHLLAGAGVSLVLTIGWLSLAVLATAWLVGSRLDDERIERTDTADRRLALLAARTEERWASVQDLAHELRNPLAVMATMDMGVGVGVRSAGGLGRLDWSLCRRLGGIRLAFGVVLLAEPGVLHSWLGTHAASGWLVVIIGALMLVTAVVHPMVLGDEGDGIS